MSTNLIQRVNVGDSLTRSAAARPAQLAVVDGERRWTYAELDAWVDRLAHGLAARGYTRGDALGLASGDSAEMMYRGALEHASFAGRDLSSLRRAVYAMAPMPEPLITACLDGFGCEFALLFGQTEMSPVTTLFRPEHQLSHVGAVGTPITGVQVAIMAPDGALLPAGEKGEIVYRGPSTMNGYLANTEATDEAFKYGWFHSGDVGWFGDDGVLWFADRYKDVIKTGGENVASLEVERAVYAADPRVAEAVVIGLPHDRWSEAITAVVVAKPGETIDPAELTTAMRAHLDAYKIPKAVIVVDELPKTSTGKIQKNVVRDEHRTHYS